MPKLLKSGTLSEKEIHKSVIKTLSYYPKIHRYIIHIPNEGKRETWYGKLLKALGMRKGASDLFLAMGRHGYFGAWIELKSRDGIVSISQREFLEDMRSQNYFTSVCYSYEEAMKVISWYCYPEKNQSLKDYRTLSTS